MSIQLSNRTFTDVYGNDYSLYKANSGDDIKVRIDFTTSVSTKSSTTNIMNFYVFTKEVIRTEGSWIDDGFRIGDVVTFIEKDSSNITTFNYNLTILSISDKVITVNGLPSINGGSVGSGSIWYFFTNKAFQELELNINWIENLLNISFDSAIDQESVKLTLKGLDSLSVTSGAGSGTDLIQVGKKSGSFAVQNPKIWRFPNQVGLDPSEVIYSYTIIYTVTDLGVLFPSFYVGQFNINFIELLKLKVKSGDSFYTSLQLTDPSNTGYFDEAFNDEATITTSKEVISEVYYNHPNIYSLTFSVNDTSVTEVEFGSIYNIIEEDYNQNVFESQSELLYLLKTGLIGTSDIGSAFNDFNSDVYFILNNFSFSDSSGIRTFVIDFTLFFNLGFQNFIESRGAFERLFTAWVKIGNTNNLIYNNQLLFKSAVGSEFNSNKLALINHDNNNNYSDNSFFPLLDTKIDKDVNIEDDIAYFIDFDLNINDINEAIIVEIYSDEFITETNELILERFSFDISNQDLQYFVRMTAPISNNLPNSSAKKEAYLQVKTPYNPITGILEVRLYYPFIIRWEYWIKQLNATSFYNSKNIGFKDWKNYSDSFLYSTQLNIRTKIRRNSVEDFNKYTFDEKNEVQYYDGSSDINSTINLYDYPSLTPLNSIENGKQILIEAVHVLPKDWNYNRKEFLFGDVRIYEKESNPSYLMSTEIDTDVNSLNPLYGINNNRLETEYFTIAPNFDYPVKFTCLLDTNKLNGSEYCITSRISDNGEIYNGIEKNKITEEDSFKITEDLNQKITD